MASEVGIIRRREGGADVLLVYGEVDSDGAGDLHEAIQGALAGGGGRVVIDLGELEFISSSGIKVLLDAVESAEAQGISLTLRPPPPTVLRIFGMAGVAARLFPLR